MQTYIKVQGSSHFSFVKMRTAAPERQALFRICRGLYTRPMFESIEAIILKKKREEHVASIAVGVVRDGRILWEKGFGWAELARDGSA